jgi:hypothetical protein
MKDIKFTEISIVTNPEDTRYRTVPEGCDFAKGNIRTFKIKERKLIMKNSTNTKHNYEGIGGIWG